MMTLDQRMDTDMEERLAGKPISGAVNLAPVMQVKNSKAANEFSTQGLPGYFCGDRGADTVVVNLNPGIDADEANKSWDEDTQSFNKSSVQSFINDLKAHSENYGRIDKDRYDSFDIKQAAFFYDWKDSGLNLPSMPQAGWDDKGFCLEAKSLVLLNKLQLELVPYASAKFAINKGKKGLFFPYVDTLLDEIFKKERKYVVFASAIFEDIFKAYNKDYKADTFDGVDDPAIKPGYYFKKKDGTDMKFKLRCKVITINYGGRKQKALIAHSLPSQPLANAFGIHQQYGAFCYQEFIK
jgi:hypothetical protein